MNRSGCLCGNRNVRETLVHDFYRPFDEGLSGSVLDLKAMAVETDDRHLCSALSHQGCGETADGAPDSTGFPASAR